jgi:hypothetical protein
MDNSFDLDLNVALGKVCNICNIDKLLTDYYVYKNIYSYACKICMRQYQRDKYLSRKNSVKITPKTKKCIRCNKRKSTIKNYMKIQCRKDGYSNICKKCTSANVNRRRKKIFAERILLKNKVCLGCGLNLSISNFGNQLNNKDGYNNKCKKCRKNH